MLAEIVDGVVGGDTHRDTHALEMTAPSGVTVATLSISNDDAGYAEALAWIAEHAPGPRMVVALEGTRSFGIGLARAVSAAGLAVVEVERPRRIARRRGKSDLIDARLAALHALRLDADRLPTPRADGDREALRILLSARREMVATRTRTVNRLRALLLTGDEADRELSRQTLTCGRLAAIGRQRGPRNQAREQSVRRAEARRLARAIQTLRRDLADNKTQLAELVADLAPALRAKHGVGPVSAAQAIVSWSHPGRCRNEAAYANLGGVSPVPASSGRPSATASTAAATAPSTAPSTTSS